MAIHPRKAHTDGFTKVGDYRWTPSATSKYEFERISLKTTDQYISLACAGEHFDGITDAIAMDKSTGAFPDEEVELYLEDVDTYPSDFIPLTLGTTSSNEIYIVGKDASRVGSLSLNLKTGLWSGSCEDSNGNYMLVADGKGFRFQAHKAWTTSKRLTYSKIAAPDKLNSYYRKQLKGILDGV